MTRLEDGFKEVNRGVRDLNSKFNKVFMEVGEIKGRQKEISWKDGP